MRGRISFFAKSATFGAIASAVLYGLKVVGVPISMAIVLSPLWIQVVVLGWMLFLMWLILCIEIVMGCNR